MNRLLPLLASFVFVVPVISAELWPQFRGPTGDGIASTAKAPTHWSENENIVWKTPVAGRGWSSPVVADGIVYLTTAVEETPSEEERLAALEQKGENPKHYKQKHIAKAITLGLVSLDLASGEIKRKVDLVRLESPDAIHIVNSYSSPTPVIQGDLIYCHFGTFGTICLNRHEMTEVWRRRLPLEHSVGPGSSPFVYEDLLVLICDGVDRQYVTALDRKTGETLWEAERPEMDAPTGDQKKSFDTPIAIKDALGRNQLICMGSQWLVSYDPASGKELWKVRHGKGFSVVPRPVYSDGVVYISTGFGKPQLWAISVDGSGDVSDTHVRWVETKGIPAKPSPLVVGDHIFVISDDGIASCFAKADGELLWKERIGGKYSASPLLAGNLIYVVSESGKTTVVQPGDAYQMVAQNQLDGHFMASPAAISGFMLVRSATALYRIGAEDEESK